MVAGDFSPVFPQSTNPSFLNHSAGFDGLWCIVFDLVCRNKKMLVKSSACEDDATGVKMIAAGDTLAQYVIVLNPSKFFH